VRLTHFGEKIYCGLVVAGSLPCWSCVRGWLAARAGCAGNPTDRMPKMHLSFELLIEWNFALETFLGEV